MKFTRILAEVVEPDIAARRRIVGDVALRASAPSGAIDELVVVRADVCFFVLEVLAEDMIARLAVFPASR